MGLANTISSAVKGAFPALDDLRTEIDYVVVDDPVYNATTGQSAPKESIPYHVFVVILKYRRHEIDGSQIVSGDFKVLIPVGDLNPVPKVNDKIRVPASTMEADARIYKVKDVGKDTADAVWTLQVGV